MLGEEEVLRLANEELQTWESNCYCIHSRHVDDTRYKSMDYLIIDRDYGDVIDGFNDVMELMHSIRNKYY